MKIGLFGINFGLCGNVDSMTSIATAAEAAGIESVWTGEHVVLPDPRVAPSPSDPQTPFLDPAVALSHIAAHTTRLRLGTGVIILPQRNPLVLAKELASVDVVSKGRLIFGLGAGYLEPEFRALAAPFEDRGAVTDEAIEAVKALWTMEKPAYQGRFFSFEGIDSQPRPVQRPHPPIVVGGMSRSAARRAARYGNGWFGFLTDIEATTRSLEWIEAYIADGLRPAELGGVEISVTPPMRLTREVADRYEEIGVHRIIPLSAATTLDEALRGVDTLGEIASQFRHH
ncbi:MAG TPA: LLM class F420-dependent oxidoreductase [Blastocatellia bacterium]|nr:LLM class F420-dependent oxidoreductase [Blastocatellia bacterium]